MPPALASAPLVLPPSPWFGVVVVLALLVLVLALVMWSRGYRPDPRYRALVDPPPLESALPGLAGLSNGTIAQGNAVTLLHDDAYFESVLDAIASAERSIHFETYLWEDGRVSDEIAGALAARAADGLEVRVLVDAVGSSGLGAETERRMTQAGCRFERYHRRSLAHIGRINNRDHRKLSVYDGRVAFVGGHCITDGWRYGTDDKPPFRDISLRLEGPVVHALQSTFASNWIETTGELFVGEHVWPALEPRGEVPVHVARVTLEGAASSVEVLHHVAIQHARERIWIQNPYFLPDPKSIRALRDAVRRGVDVRVMAPSAAGSDVPMIQHAARHLYARLLEAGVRLFEYEPTLLHQKTMIVDSAWCAVGSSNFDDRSFELNDEITLGIADARLAAELERIFEDDLRECEEILPEAWARRGLGPRVLGAVLYLVNEQL